MAEDDLWLGLDDHPLGAELLHPRADVRHAQVEQGGRCAGLQEQPAQQGVRDDLNGLVDTLLLECTPGNPCNTTRTLTMMKGVCAAVLSSAALTIH